MNIKYAKSLFSMRFMYSHIRHFQNAVLNTETISLSYRTVHVSQNDNIVMHITFREHHSGMIFGYFIPSTRIKWDFYASGGRYIVTTA